MLCILVLKCSSKSTNECDYISVTKVLLGDIKKGNTKAIKKLMAFRDDEFWSEGGKWGAINRGS